MLTQEQFEEYLAFDRFGWNTSVANLESTQATYCRV